MNKTLYIILIFILPFSNLFSQQRTESLKRAALVHMQAGRYGEAIDQLHKYVAANARSSDGYNLRGLCYEKRHDYQYAVLDFRRAVRLTPDDEEYRNNLNRVLAIWHQLLYEKIEGHKREIAIDPKNPINYLEIGKSYRWLEEWALAEQWYDEYLRRDDNASPDEIIRYTEILSHTGSIVKGEKILKKYVDRHPDDWRLWSRYGYFTMWLGNYQNAKDAFTKALGFKPFFKEAQDGLDQANNEGYLTQQTPRSFEREYPIDRYYRLLRKRPEDDDARFKLVEELIATKRYEEANQQLVILAYTQADNERFIKMNDFISTLRDSLYESNIQEYSAAVKIDPKDKNAVIRLADAYGKLYAFEDGIEILDEYLEDVPRDQELDMRYKLAQFSAWNYEWEKAIEQSDILISLEPDNIDYMLLRGQISVWTVLGLDEAEVMLNKVLEARPRDINAVLSLASLNSWQRDFEKAGYYVKLAKEIDPNSRDVEEAESNYQLHLSAFEEVQLFKLKGDAFELAGQGECGEALEKFDEYLSKITGPNRDELKQYASINLCAGEYSNAVSIYDDLLDNEYDFDLALQRAKANLWGGDTTRAVEEFENLTREQPDHYLAHLLLGDSYTMAQKYPEAYDTFEKMLDGDLDEEQEIEIKQRLEYLPPIGLHAGFIGLIDILTPQYIGLSPTYTYFADNQNLKFHSYGGRLDFGFTGFLTLGGSFYRTIINDGSSTIYMNRLLGNATIRFSEFFSLDGGYGSFNTLNETKKNIYYLTAQYVVKEKNKLNISAGIEHTDARIILYSPGLMNVNLNIDVFRFNSEYVHKDLVKIALRYNYYSITDGNRGNDLNLRIGKRFLDQGFFGYEYYFVDYSTRQTNYYSPQNVESHSLWGDWELEDKDKLKITLGGKLGYYPSFDNILNEIYAQAQYIPYKSLTINGRVSMGSSYRFDSSYNSYSISLSAYWNIY
ncbi:MAG: tetratricopeptide repeat protein [Bacteroidetes bacterium]|nr:tetratricopeptide repeat protein [Bacteroidota bacterium]